MQINQNDGPAGTLELLGFAFSAPVENPLQRLILFIMSNCPDSSGEPGVITSYDYLERHCMTSAAEIKKQITRMAVLGVLCQAEPYPDMTPDLVRFICIQGA